MKFLKSHFKATALLLLSPIVIKAQAPIGLDTLNLIQIGPLIESMPHLDSLVVNKKDSVENKVLHSKKNNLKAFPMNASGFFYRGISVGQYGNNSFNGGLRLQIAGKISEKTQIMGVITDESLPIQPEGSTADLEELDKVYINVSSSLYSLQAGDIETGEARNSLNLYRRKITGISSDIQINNGQIRTVFGQSKGTFHRMEIKGQDGNQGPYLLKSKEGRTGVVVIAGSERIWINGIALKRGEDQDYIIDYSQGELIFMPKNLIFFDTDIDIEYQYQEANYSSNYFETAFSKNPSEKSQLEIKYVAENQDIGSSSLSIDQKNAFRKTDVLLAEGFYPDSLGEYVLENNVFKFFPNEERNIDRYKVVFSPDPDGKYIRKVSQQERMYYEHIGNEAFAGLRFSPGQSVLAPNGKNVLQVSSKYKLGEYSNLNIESIFSQNRKNLLRKSNSQIHGSALNIQLNQSNISLGSANLAFQASHKMNSKNYQSLGRDRYVNFNERWDFDYEDLTNEISISKLGSQFKTTSTEIDLGLYKMTTSLGDRLRFQSSINHQSRYIKNATLMFNRVNHNTLFNQASSNVTFLGGSTNPFVITRHEMRQKDYKFDDVIMGVSFLKNQRFLSLGLGGRTDWLFNAQNLRFVQNKKFRFAQLDYRSSSRGSWKQELMYRSKNPIKSSQQSVSFESARIAINYNDVKSPLRLDLVLNAQNSINEFRSILYDSVGIGRGSFRYDPVLNEYIRDENGAFVSSNIVLGDRQQGFNSSTISRIFFDFKKTKYQRLNHIKLRLSIRGDYLGPEKNFMSAVKSRSAKIFRHQQRYELISQKTTRSIRTRVWFQSNTNFNGMDFRGWVDKRSDSVVMENQIPIKTDYYLLYDLNIHSFLTKTNNAIQIPRSTDGIYHELGIKRSLPGNIQLTVKSIIYQDKTIIQSFSKDASAYGLKTDIVKFLGDNGRLDCTLDYYNANGFPGMPPEALKGISANETLRATLAASKMLDRSISINVSMSYIDDERYENFFQISGELRAYF
mgnify:FL=1